MIAHKKNAGFSLLEVTISAAAMAAVLGVSVYLSLVGSNTVETGMTQNHLEARMRQTIERVADAVHDARLGSLNPDPQAPLGSSTLDFQVLDDIVNGVPIWGDTVRVAFEYAVGEIDNGVDDNGNGLVDEGVVVWTQNPGAADEWRNVLVNGVAEHFEGETLNVADDNGNGLIDEAGLSFVLDGTTLTIRLCLESAGEGGKTHRDTAETAVRLHN